VTPIVSIGQEPAEVEDYATRVSPQVEIPGDKLTALIDRRLGDLRIRFFRSA
jgi:hypothetical protein